MERNAKLAGMGQDLESMAADKAQFQNMLAHVVVLMMMMMMMMLHFVRLLDHSAPPREVFSEIVCQIGDTFFIYIFLIILTIITCIEQHRCPKC